MNTFATLPLSFLTASNLAHRASYSASLLVAEKVSLNDFSMVMLLGDMMTILTLNPFWLATPSIYNSQDKGGGASTIMIFLLKSHSCLGLSNNLF